MGIPDWFGRKPAPTEAAFVALAIEIGSQLETVDRRAASRGR